MATGATWKPTLTVRFDGCMGACLLLRVTDYGVMPSARAATGLLVCHLSMVPACQTDTSEGQRPIVRRMNYNGIQDGGRLGQANRGISVEYLSTPQREYGMFYSIVNVPCEIPPLLWLTASLFLLRTLTRRVPSKLQMVLVPGGQWSVVSGQWSVASEWHKGRTYLLHILGFDVDCMFDCRKNGRGARETYCHCLDCPKSHAWKGTRGRRNSVLNWGRSTQERDS
ncbi:uncharacterized protein RAG0_11487 [Rhynchosporium agropyri]|uniref:Uncharacterized protein n=1 Tax=Rhynchosporium agropyri TaxID=914238 RepID=A0A1E1L495_9HELO|nr:uncharacterized protein RAG0_11487 [Rhynchosporium agropyri]